MIKYNLVEKNLPAPKSKYRKRKFKTSSGKTYKSPTAGSTVSVRPNVNWFKDDDGRNALDHLSMTLHKGSIKSGTPEGPKSHAAHAVVLTDVNLHPDDVINHSSRKRALSKGLNKKGFPYKDPHAFAHGKLVSGGRAPDVGSVAGMKRLKYDIVQGYYHLEGDANKKPVIHANRMVAIADHNPLGVRGGFYVSNVKHARKNTKFAHQSQEESYVEATGVELLLDEEAYRLLIEDRGSSMPSLDEAINTVLNEGSTLEKPSSKGDLIYRVAKSHGYSNVDVEGTMLRHDDGHALIINPDGGWIHKHSKEDKMVDGKGGRSLDTHLEKHHGGPKSLGAALARGHKVVYRYSDGPKKGQVHAVVPEINEGASLGPVYEIDRIRNMLINFGYNPLISGIEFAKASAAGNQVFENPDGSKVSIVITGTDKTHGTWTFESKMKTKCGKSKKTLELLLLGHAMGEN